MNRQDILELRRQARAEKSLHDQDLLAMHARVADAMEDPHSEFVIRSQALEQINKWEAGRLCLPRYAKEWRAILDLAPGERRAAMLRNDPGCVALRQNSPFGAIIHHLDPVTA